ncbi:DUF4192 family protein [Pseudoclavibacter helvolus]|uniref:DUF4192 family protein n=1 Tax=Pseudoclavibacter helvolus TaxID=255205 RepID=UPI003C770303
MQEIRLTTPQQILDAVPRLLGYTPVGSLVAIPLNGKRGGVVLRFDLPAEEGQGGASTVSYASGVIGHLARLDRVERVVFVFSPDVPFGQGPIPPYSVLAEELASAADRAGIEVVLCICRAADAWGVYGCDDPDCCDIGPRDLGTQEHWLAAAPRPADSPALPKAAPARRATFSRADELHWQVHDGEDDLEALRQRLLASFAPAAFAPAPDDAHLARLLCMLRGHYTTELLLVTIAFGASPSLLSLAPVWAVLMSDDDEHEQLPPFSRVRVRRAVDVFRGLSALVEDDDEPLVLSCLSWLEWASGRSSAAASFATQTLASAPDDPLAASVAWLVARCVVPPWLSVVEHWQDDVGSSAPVGREG